MIAIKHKIDAMIENELRELIEKVQRRGCEGQTLEIKSAHKGCPERLYDTISAFANQDDGGVLLFGLDEKAHFAKVGVYDAQDLQKKVTESEEQNAALILIRKGRNGIIEPLGTSFMGGLDFQSLPFASPPLHFFD